MRNVLTLLSLSFLLSCSNKLSEAPAPAAATGTELCRQGGPGAFEACHRAALEGAAAFLEERVVAAVEGTKDASGPGDPIKIQLAAQKLLDLSRRKPATGSETGLAGDSKLLQRFLVAAQVLPYSKQQELHELLPELEQRGGEFARLEGLMLAAAVLSYGGEAPWRHRVAALVGPICPRLPDRLLPLLCVPSAAPTVYGECELDVARIPAEKRKQALDLLRKECPELGEDVRAGMLAWYGQRIAAAGSEPSTSPALKAALKKLGQRLPQELAGLWNLLGI